MKFTPEEYKEHFKDKDKFAQLFGAQFISVNETECLYEYNFNPAHCNPSGILHGGTLYGVMDSSQGALIHFTLEETYRAAATGTATIKYLAPVTEGKVKIRSYFKGSEGRKVFVNSEAFSEDGKLVATLEEVWVKIL
jgi:acyl-CoA thioesterase